jgi:methyl-accepting chemotaxis protein
LKSRTAKTLYPTAALAGLLVTRSITVPLGKAVWLTEAVAAGDLSVQVDIDGRDEVSPLLEALGRMTGRSSPR